MQSVVDTLPNASRSEGAASQIPRRASFRRAVEDLGGGTIFAFKLVQLLAILGLLGTSLAQLILGTRVAVAYNLLKPTEVVQIAQCALYAYLAVLGSLALFGAPPLNGRAYNHASWILALVWGVYMYRDVYPLATLNKTPVDTTEGPAFYAKFVLLTIAAVLVPVFVPRKYAPANPKVRPRRLHVSVFPCIFLTPLCRRCSSRTQSRRRPWGHCTPSRSSVPLYGLRGSFRTLRSTCSLPWPTTTTCETSLGKVSP